MTNVPPDLRFRIGQSREQFGKLKSDYQVWQSSLKDLPLAGLLSSRLRALNDLMDVSLNLVSNELGNVVGDIDKGACYEQCRRIDNKTVWLRRIWSYYRDRIEQRFKSENNALLQAAEEVIWCCIAPVANANDGRLGGFTPPLPYLEPQSAPRAFVRNRTPTELRFDADQDFFKQCMAIIPIPLVGLPQESTERPWELAALAHEIGHHLLHERSLKDALTKEYAKAIAQLTRQALTSKGLVDEGASERWVDWREEVFADLFAVTQLGEAAAWIIREAILTDTGSMWAASVTGEYPPVGIRQAILQCACRELDVTPDKGAYASWQQDSLQVPAGDQQSQTDLALVPELVRSMLDYPLFESSSLRSLGSEKLPCTYRVEDVSARLVHPLGDTPSDEADSTGLVLAAGVHAFATLTQIESKDEQLAKLGNLKKNLPARLIATRDSVLRDYVPASPTQFLNEFVGLLERVPMHSTTWTL